MTIRPTDQAFQNAIDRRSSIAGDPGAAMNAVAWRYWSKNLPAFYVESLKGRIGDWGYTTNPNKAIPLSPYWQRRFAADCRYAGVTAQFRAI